MIKTIGIDKDITIADNIRFILTTTDSNDCPQTPYKVNKIVIYFISREFTDTTYSQYNNEIISNKLKNQYEQAKKTACDYPTQENIDNLKKIKDDIENSKTTSTFYFKDAIPIASFGGYVDEKVGVKDRLQKETEPDYTYELRPVWLNPDLVPEETVDQVNQDNILIPYQENGMNVPGKFIFEWNPVGQREGDYFICWNWTPNIAGDSLSSHMMFNLIGNSRLTASIPTHYTRADKYQILMEKYLPDMFKNFLSDSDLSPYVLQELNLSVAKGFTFVEDHVNQIIDLLDANSIHEQLIPLLSNLFNLKLKSNDPTLWRRQTKKAIPNYKKKGTISGLRSALSDGGSKLLKLTRMWQVFSKYSYQEYFEKTNDSNEFVLSKNVYLPITDVFELWHRPKNSSSWVELSLDYVDIQPSVGGLPYICTWVGENLLESPISLEMGDSFRILYQTDYIPEEKQSLEEYIRSLSLMDKRDERDQEYPPKNWNTRLLEEDDPLFDLIIPIKHPIKDRVIWGKVRTEFPYSENVYNMEEYNGSTRDSANPCDIDKNFIDPCDDCQSSVFSIDVEIEELSSSKLLECEEIIKEFVPFHSLIHSLNYLGSKNEFIRPPFEEINILISFSKEDIVISGEAQHIFNRSIKKAIQNSNTLSSIKRNMLAKMNDETGLVSGIARNKKIRLFAPNLSTQEDLQNFAGKSSSFYNRNIALNNLSGDPLDNSNLLEVLSPSTNAGKYSVSSVQRGSFDVISQGLYAVSEPLDKSQFEFRISNKIHEESSVNIDQKDLFIFTDNNFNFSEINIVSQKDIDQGFAQGNPHKIKITADSNVFEYEILEIQTDYKFILKGPDDGDEFYVNKDNLSWELSGSTQFASGEKGLVQIIKRGLVHLNNNLIKIGDYVLYDENQYKIKSLAENKFYIENYDSGNVGGVDIKIYRRIVENCIGQFDYYGLELIAPDNYESELLIQNGANSSGSLTKSSYLKENFLILINSDYYSILEIDGTTITLDGPNNDWTTLGTSTDFVIYRFISQLDDPIEIPESINPPIPGHEFTQIFRSNNDIIESTTSMAYMANKILNSTKSGSDFVESSGQNESISFNIEYKDGEKQEGKL